ncbi:putative mitochondrial hypothetical protein [Leptomonas pyrrhocoris]|uniref:Uncharacterized protein n=1 Tax=Leptomonas pyrrhocoris TaxID=157538 RepID=A0A0N0DYS9_LEPPY|nr:putative mitochondrial hypothetical protein [Leptomonas pyrrhocoris]KPA84475.1 putative mitochondrial hypothetical protein [Leptomonas pyrrhocoris]|eukprot:XP_015662914.1 putative mitochondrial hypothetical protein [Leptomonas pyrrhocoris]
MFRSTVARLSGSPTYGNWPWPAKLPLKKDWYHRLSRRESIADETRQYMVVGDALLVCVMAFSAYRVYVLNRNNSYQTHLCHLMNCPPAIIANEFDFKNPSANRTLERKDLDTYREEVVSTKASGKPLESVIFKY